MAVAAAAAAFCSMSVAGTSAAAPGTRAPASSHVAASSGGWGTAQKVPGLEALNAGTWAEIFSVSCASAGSCSAGGHYYDVSGNILPFVVDEKHGSWGTAQKVQVPGLAAQGQVDAEIISVSCGSAGNCSAGGYY